MKRPKKPGKKKGRDVMRGFTCQMTIVGDDGQERICGAQATTFGFDGYVWRYACRACTVAHDDPGDEPPPDSDDEGEGAAGHCNIRKAGCFQNDGGAVEVCACECRRCVKARERLLKRQGDDPDAPEHGDPSGNGGAGPVH